MNCANHPDVAVAAYCQSCGKPLCAACVRSVGGVVYCEQCLGARLSSGPAAGGLYGANPTGLHAHPLLAALLGFIPGVGAMYNGQFIKALAHVLIFAVFVSLSDKSFVFGLLIAAWIFYQVFDAAQTARARRDGLPLPNPFGLNDLGTRLGIAAAPVGSPYAAGFAAAPPGTPVDPAPSQTAATGMGSDPGWNPVQPPPGPSYAVPPGVSGMPYPGSPSPGPNVPYGNVPAGPGYGAPLARDPQGNRYPLGAVVLIAIGVILLLHTLGIFEDEWVGRVWPLILIGIGGWLLYRRTRDTAPGNGRGGF
jgi:Domain of unknown function (DUF5668)/B-box zinc finger